MPEPYNSCRKEKETGCCYTSTTKIQNESDAVSTVFTDRHKTHQELDKQSTNTQSYASLHNNF